MRSDLNPLWYLQFFLHLRHYSTSTYPVEGHTGSIPGSTGHNSGKILTHYRKCRDLTACLRTAEGFWSTWKKQGKYSASRHTQCWGLIRRTHLGGIGPQHHPAHTFIQSDRESSSDSTRVYWGFTQGPNCKTTLQTLGLEPATF